MVVNSVPETSTQEPNRLRPSLILLGSLTLVSGIFWNKFSYFDDCPGRTQDEHGTSHSGNTPNESEFPLTSRETTSERSLVNATTRSISIDFVAFWKSLRETHQSLESRTQEINLRKSMLAELTIFEDQMFPGAENQTSNELQEIFKSLIDSEQLPDLFASLLEMVERHELVAENESLNYLDIFIDRYNQSFQPEAVGNYGEIFYYGELTERMLESYRADPYGRLSAFWKFVSGSGLADGTCYLPLSTNLTSENDEGSNLDECNIRFEVAFSLWNDDIAALIFIRQGFLFSKSASVAPEVRLTLLVAASELTGCISSLSNPLFIGLRQNDLIGLPPIVKKSLFAQATRNSELMGLLGELFQDSTAPLDDRVTALQSLSLSKNISFEDLCSVLKDPSELIRAAAVVGLGAYLPIQNGDYTEPQALKTRKILGTIATDESQEPSIRIVALQNLIWAYPAQSTDTEAGKISHHDFFASLALNDQDPQIRITAAFACQMGRVMDPNDVNSLFSSAKDPAVRYICAKLLEQEEGFSSSEIIQILSEPPPHELIEYAAWRKQLGESLYFITNDVSTPATISAQFHGATISSKLSSWQNGQ